jgi:hypothetical protein
MGLDGSLSREELQRVAPSGAGELFVTERSPASAAELDRVEARIDAWLAAELLENPAIEAVDRGDGDERRWYVRLRGEEKSTFTVWFTLRQRTLHYEVYFLPAPVENAAAFYAHLLGRNLGMYGAAFAIGAEDAVYLVGQLDVASVTTDELDRVLGSLFTYVERAFSSALRLGFASALRARSKP